MSQNSQYAKAFVTLLAFALFAVGCTKQRDASLPDGVQEAVFSISEFGELQTENSQFKVETDDSLAPLSLGDASKATAEKGQVAISDAEVPSRLKFMFLGLQITGQVAHSYPTTFSVDKQFVTAYKVVTDPSELTILEKQLALVKDEVVIQKQMQKTKDIKQSKALVASLQKARDGKQALLLQKSATLLVPMFKFKVLSYGVLQRVKNDLKEETSTLQLKTSEWADATHIQISTNSVDRMPVGLDPASRGDLDRTFLMNRINNKIMTAETLRNEYQIPLNLDAKARVLTVLDTDALHVFEVTQLGKTVLTDSQTRQLKAGSDKSNVRACSAEVLSFLPEDAKKDCILVLRYDVAVTYVNPELPVVDYDGNQDSRIQFKPVRAGENVGLVQIPKGVEAKKIESNNEMDPNTTVRVMDIKDKEFFFRRTLEDAPETSIFEAGMSAALTIVKFELEETRLVVRKADRLVDYKFGSNDQSYEELMSIPVTYKKREFKDASGAAYSSPRLVPATRADAEYVDLDWTRNALSSGYSPYLALQESCIRSIADSKVSDVDMKLDKGVLNFSFNYSVVVNGECIMTYNTNDYNGTPSYQANARLKERVSFKLNDGTTNETFVQQVPFTVQNELGYGVWTIGKTKPTDTGIIGRLGQEDTISVVQDFRNDRKVVYTLTGLENRNNEIDPEIRKMYIEGVNDIVNSWDFAYHQVFKGSKMDRPNGRYIELQIAGENGVEARVGDLDKNIIHFENKVNDNTGTLGVSQVGYNPRSGIVVADSLIVYAGNLQQFIGRYQRNMKIAQTWEDQKKVMKAASLAEFLANQKATEEEAKKSGTGQDASPALTTEVTKQVAQLAKGKKVDPAVINKIRALSKISTSAAALATTVKERQALGGIGSFKYGSPEGNYGWLDRALRQIAKNPGMDNLELRGVIARELLVSQKDTMSAEDQTSLARVAKLGELRTKMNTQFSKSPGCQLIGDDTMARNFTAASFKEALRLFLHFDLGHEMGHSQGLTHNFIGSFDKANFVNEDGSATKRNYSSIMDYFPPGGFNWDGIGTYDIHALRASHLGLLESATPGKFVTIQSLLGDKADLNNFSKAKVAGKIRPYKYCTDIHVGYEPTCQRFDYGTTATEIVTNMIDQYDNNYVNNYYSWDRNKFGLREASGVVGGSMSLMFQMRQFMDELYYKLITRTATQDEIQDYAAASIKAYQFYNQVIRTPDAPPGTPFLSKDRFVAVPYTYTTKDDNGTETTVQDVEVVETKVTTILMARTDRVDTIGIENDKIIAMQLLTLKGYPAYKYESNNVEFSFVDFEKLLGMPIEQSFVINTFTGMLLNNLSPTFSNASVDLHTIPGATAAVTANMRAYAGIYGILNLQASTLRDEDNYANLFKVGASIGKSPKDRISLSALGASATSTARMSYWAADNALVAQSIVEIADKKAFFIQKAPEIQPAMEAMVLAQLIGSLTGDSDAAKAKAADNLEKAKVALVAKLNAVNSKGEIISAEQLKANPAITIEKQVDNLVLLNTQYLVAVKQIAVKPESASEYASLVTEVADLADSLPLFSIAQKALVGAMTKAGPALAASTKVETFKNLGTAASAITDDKELETSYSLILKNIQFMSTLTGMTNPEYKAK